MDKLQSILDRLIELDSAEMSRYFVSKLIYPMGHLRVLSKCLNSTFIDENIPDQAHLVFVGQQNFTWDMDYKGPNVKLSKDGLQATLDVDIDQETVVGTIPINSGKHYWEVKLDKFIELDCITLGVVLKGFDLRTRLFETGKFYGWMCTGAKKIFPSHENNCVP